MENIKKYRIIKVNGRKFMFLAEKNGLEAPLDSSLRNALIAKAKEIMSENRHIDLIHLYSDKLVIASRNLDRDNDEEKAQQKIKETMQSLGEDFFKEPVEFSWELIYYSNKEDFLRKLAYKEYSKAHLEAMKSKYYWALRDFGLSADNARLELKNISDNMVTLKDKMSECGASYEEMEIWQKRGVLLYRCHGSEILICDQLPEIENFYRMIDNILAEEE